MSYSRFGLTGWTRLPGLRCLSLSRLVLVRASGSCFSLSHLVLIRASSSCFSLSRLTFCSPILGRLALSGFALGGLVFSGLTFRSLTLSSFILSRLILGGFVRRTRFLSCYYSRTAKLARLRRCSDCRPSPVHRRQQRVVGTGGVHMLGLHRSCRRVLLVHRSLFRSCRTSGNSTLAAVIADVIHSGFIDHGLAVNIGNVGLVYVIHRAVVIEASIVPISAPITYTTVAEAVVDAAVKADALAPIALIPGEGIAAPAPIAGSPEQVSHGRFDPRAGNPKIAFLAIRPVAGRPQIAGRGDHGLTV